MQPFSLTHEGPLFLLAILASAVAGRPMLRAPSGAQAHDTIPHMQPSPYPVQIHAFAVQGADHYPGAPSQVPRPPTHPNDRMFRQPSWIDQEEAFGASHQQQRKSFASRAAKKAVHGVTSCVGAMCGGRHQHQTPPASHVSNAAAIGGLGGV